MIERTLFGEAETAKRCSRCGRYKSLSEFNLHTDDGVHRQAYCRSCQHAYAREHATGGVRCGTGKPASEAQRAAYNELYSLYRRYRLYRDAYAQHYDDPDDRLSFEFAMGL